MTAAQLIAEFVTMLKEHWAYVWGAAEEGVVDCSGAFVYAMAKYGLKIAHGSNSIRRYWLTECGKIGKIKLIPGMAVFKWREDGEPDKFAADGLDDFYHIGLYIGDGRVLEARGTKAGFVEGKLSDGWDYAGKIKGIKYEGKIEVIPVIGHVKVNTPNGGILNIRDSNNKDIGDITNGTVLPLLEKTSAAKWKVEYNGTIGFCATEYLTEVQSETAADEVALVMSRDAALALKAAIIKAGL